VLVHSVGLSLLLLLIIRKFHFVEFLLQLLLHPGDLVVEALLNGCDMGVFLAAFTLEQEGTFGLL